VRAALVSIEIWPLACGKGRWQRKDCTGVFAEAHPRVAAVNEQPRYGCELSLW